jgi:hypothetical protein
MKLPIPASPILRTLNPAHPGRAMPEITASSRWRCDLFFGPRPETQGYVDIWWGHNTGAASWACDQWISSCGNDPGGCEASPA